MKFIRTLALVLTALISVAPIANAAPLPYTGSQPIQNGGNGDVTTYLGANPFFPTGLVQDQYSTLYKFVVDSTATTPAAVGKIVYFNGSSWIQAATANLALPWGTYGVVVSSASSVGGVAVICVKGQVIASVKTGGSVAVAANTPLAITTTGDLTATAAATTPGVTWGIGVQSLAISQSATLITIQVGGY